MSDQMIPRVTKLNFERITMVFTKDTASETLIGLTKQHAFVSKNFGVSWKRIDRIESSLTLYFDGYRIPRYDEVKIVEPGCGFILDIEGNVVKEVSNSPNYFSPHPNNPNVIVSECEDPMDYYQDLYCYTTDGGSTWEDIESNDDPFVELSFEFVEGGVPDLMYKNVEDSRSNSEWTEYALNVFSGSPLEFTKLPILVSKSQDTFYGFKDKKELYVSKNGVDFQHIEFPNSQRYDSGTECFIYGQHMPGVYGMAKESKERLKGSLFIHMRYPPTKLKGPNRRSLPWTTLFRYDMKLNEIKLMLEYCYDSTVISAEEGIVIANVVTNPQEYLNNNETPNVKTVITFNDGKSWGPMKGPSEAEFNVSNRIWDNALIPSVPGLIIMHGKEGPLEDYWDMTYSEYEKRYFSSFSSYITKDSGRSWRKINDLSLDWAIGGNGAIIILYAEGLNDHMLYSLDGGMTWHKLYLEIPKPGITMLAPRSCTSKRFIFEGFPRTFCLLSFDPADQEEIA